METLDLEKIHQSQLTRHVVANKLSLPLTVLQSLQDGKPVEAKLLEQAIRDLEAIIEFVDGGCRTEPSDRGG